MRFTPASTTSSECGHSTWPSTLRAIRGGELRFAEEQFVFLKLSIDEVARRTQQPAWRFFINGLGMFEGVRFASPATGRPFFATFSVDNPRNTGISTLMYPEISEARSEVVADLLYPLRGPRLPSLR